MAETSQAEALPPEDSSGLSVDPHFHDPDRMLARRLQGLEVARQLLASDPTDANRALVRALEEDVVEHTPLNVALDASLQPPTDVT